MTKQPYEYIYIYISNVRGLARTAKSPKTQKAIVRAGGYMSCTIVGTTAQMPMSGTLQPPELPHLTPLQNQHPQLNRERRQLGCHASVGRRVIQDRKSFRCQQDRPDGRLRLRGAQQRMAAWGWRPSELRIIITHTTTAKKIRCQNRTEEGGRDERRERERGEKGSGATDLEEKEEKHIRRWPTGGSGRRPTRSPARPRPATTPPSRRRPRDRQASGARCRSPGPTG